MRLLGLSLLSLTAMLPSAHAAGLLQVKGGLCLDVKDGDTRNGAPVQLYQCATGNKNQMWSFDGGALKNANGKCLDIKDGILANGRGLQMWDCWPNSQNQQWQQSGTSIKHAGSNFCVDVTDGQLANGTPLQIWQCFPGSVNQAWSSSGTPPDSGTQNPSGYLQVQGTRIVDGGGRKVMLRGTNIGGWLVTEGWMNGYTDTSDKDPYRFSLETLERRFGEQRANELINIWRDRFFTAKDLDFIASLGLNTIRVPFGFRNLQRADGSWVKNSGGNIDFARLDWVIAEAAKRNLYTILDFHIWQGQQQNYDTISANSDAGRDAQAKAAAIWTQVAKRYKGNAWIAGFDAINEPTGSYANLMQDALYKAIRAVDPERIIFMESMSADPASLKWRQVSYSLHQYDIMGSDFGSNQDAFWKRFNGEVQSFNRLNVPTYVGEFMCQKEGPTLAWVLAQYNNQNLHWTNWTYKTVDMGAWGLCNLPGNVRVNLLNDSFERIRDAWQSIGDCQPVDAVVSAFKGAAR